MELIESKILRLEDQHIELLTTEEEKNLFCTHKHINEFKKINGKIYKIKNTTLILDELIGEEVSKYFKLQTVDSTIAMEGDSICLLTELFTRPGAEYGNFYNFKDVDANTLVGLDNLDRLRYFKSEKQDKIITISKKSYNKLLKDIKKMIVRDFITTQRDRHSKNFMFEVEGNKVELMPIYDYEYSFGHGLRYRPRYIGLFDMRLDLKKVREYIKGDKYLQFLLYKSLNVNIISIAGLLKNKGVIVNPYEIEEYINYVDWNKQEIIDSKVLS